MRIFGTFLFAVLFPAALFVVAPAADAQSLDLSKITCKEFLDSDKTRKDLIIAWLDGYYLDQNTMGAGHQARLVRGRSAKAVGVLHPEPDPRADRRRGKDREIAEMHDSSR